MDASGAQPWALRLPALLAPRMDASHLEPICWSGMVKFWMVLEDAYGMGGMKAWSEHTDRELLMKLAQVWSDNAQNFPDAEVVPQIQDRMQMQMMFLQLVVRMQMQQNAAHQLYLDD